MIVSKGGELVEDSGTPIDGRSCLFIYRLTSEVRRTRSRASKIDDPMSLACYPKAVE